MGGLLKQSDTSKVLILFMGQAAAPLTGVTGVAGSITVSLSKNGAAFGAGGGAVAELAGGFYKYTPSADDLDTLGPLAVRATQATAADWQDVFQVVPFDPYDAAALGLSRLDAAVSTRAAIADYTTARAAKLDNLDATVSSRSSHTAAQVRQEMDANSTRLDTTVSSRLASGSYTAPDNTSVTAIKAKTDNLPADPASQAAILAKLPTALVSGRIDASVGAMAASSITAAAVATGAIDADALATDAVAEIADAVWDEALADHVASGSMGEALRLVRQRWGGKVDLDEDNDQLLIYAADGTTLIATLALSPAGGPYHTQVPA